MKRRVIIKKAIAVAVTMSLMTCLVPNGSITVNAASKKSMLSKTKISVNVGKKKTVKLKKGKYYINVYDDEYGFTYSLSLEDVSSYTKKLKLNYKSIAMYMNQYVDLIASPKKKGYYLKNVQWKSSNKKIAMVDSNGRVIGKKPGTCTIYAKVKGGKKVKCKFKIYKQIH